MNLKEWLEILAGMDNPAMIAIGQELAEALDVARHTHQARRNIHGKLLDACGECGLDLRHIVHERVSG